MISKRAELENYAQNVLRPNLAKAKDMNHKLNGLPVISIGVIFSVCSYIYTQNFYFTVLYFMFGLYSIAILLSLYIEEKARIIQNYDRIIKTR